MRPKFGRRMRWGRRGRRLPRRTGRCRGRLPSRRDRFRRGGLLFGGDGAGGLEGLPDGFDLVELVVVGEEAELGVVAGGAGGDEELPVGGLEQKELAAELLHDALAEGGVAPLAGGADVAGVELGGIDVGVGPGGLGVHPDLVVALGAPGAFVHGDEAGAGVVVEVVGAGDELDAGGRSRAGCGRRLRARAGLRTTSGRRARRRRGSRGWAGSASLKPDLSAS